MITMLGYLTVPFAAGILTGTIGVPLTIFVIAHIIVNAVGVGWTSDYDAGVWYPLVALLSSLSGWAYAYAYNLPNTICRRPIPKSVNERLSCGENNWERMVLRWLKFAIILLLIMASVVPFEFIRNWGGAFTLIALAISIFLFWLMYRPYPAGEKNFSMGNAFIHDAVFTFYKSVSAKDKEKYPNDLWHLAYAVLIWYSIVEVIFTVLFWAFLDGNVLWQFYTCLIVTGASFIPPIIIWMISTWTQK